MCWPVQHGLSDTVRGQWLTALSLQRDASLLYPALYYIPVDYSRHQWQGAGVFGVEP